MARLLAGGQWLQTYPAFTNLNTQPWTVAGFIYPLTNNRYTSIYSHTLHADPLQEGLLLHVDDGNIAVSSLHGGALATTRSPQNWAHANGWTHVAAYWNGTTQQAVYVNGVGKTVGPVQNAQGMNAQFFGYQQGVYNTNPDGAGQIPLAGFIGHLADWAAWSTILTDEEIESLALGFSPLLIRPELMLSYWPLKGIASPELDRRGYFPLNIPAGGGFGWSPTLFESTSPKTTYVPIRLPKVPHSPTPIDGAINQRAPLTLTWVAEGADLYDVYFEAVGAPWGTPRVTDTPYAGYSPQGLKAGVQYLWQILAKNEAGGTWGPGWYFTMTPKPTEEPDLPTEGLLVTWVEFVDSANVLHAWSGVGLADPLTYYGGYKEPRIIQAGPVTRALSDIGGTYQGADFSVTLSDYDHALRALLAGNTTKFFINRSLVVRMVNDDTRRQGFDARTVMRGLVADYKPLSDLQFQLGVQDVLTRRFSSEVASISQVPKRNIGKTDFPDCPPDSLYKPVPIIYGQVSDEGTKATTPGASVKFTWNTQQADPQHVSVGAAGTWNVKYVITLVGDETQEPPWDPANQQDERIICTLEFTDCVGPPPEDGSSGAAGEYVKGSRYTYIEWNQPLGYATKIYGRFKQTDENAPSFQGGTFGFLGYIPRLSKGAAFSRVRWVENWSRSSQDEFQPPANNMYYSGQYQAGGTILVDNGKGIIPAIYVGPKRFV